MLRLVLQKAGELGIPKLLLTCDVDNVAPCKTVLNCGGVLEWEEPYQIDDEVYYKFSFVAGGRM